MVRAPLPPLHLATLFALSILLSACGGGGGGGASTPALGKPPTATLVVSTHADSGPGSLRQAIADAPSGAWIVFDDALPAGDILLASELVVDKVLTIGGLDAAGARHGIDGQWATRIFGVAAGGLQLNDLVLHHGSSDRGGAIESVGVPVVLWRCHVHDCQSLGSGGGVWIADSSLTIADSYFEGGYAVGDGGGIATSDSLVRIDRTSFYSNVSEGGGAGAYLLGSDSTLVNCAFHLNFAISSGGAIHAGSTLSMPTSALALYNNTISTNEAFDAGGGVFIWGDDGVNTELVMHRTIVAHNAAPTGPDTAHRDLFTASGTRNMIGIGSGMYLHSIDDNTVGDAFSPFDPELLVPSPLPDGRVVSLPLPAGPAVDAVPAGQNWSPGGPPMVVDFRLRPRFPAAPSDVGAIEL